MDVEPAPHPARQDQEPAATPIEDHGVIGDLRTAALVGLDGTIDFFCAPQFDSPTVFARLLDADGGQFRLAPVRDHVRIAQRYIPDTNILVTRFMSEGGMAELTDFMPVDKGCRVKPHPDPRTPQRLMRQVRVLRGSFEFELECAPRLDYGRTRHAMEPVGTGVLFRPDGKADPTLPCLWLRVVSTGPSPIERQASETDFLGQFRLDQGEVACAVLDVLREEDEPDGTDPLDPDAVEAAFQDTLHWWHGWVGGSRYQGRWREIVSRSALVLKLMTSAQHGAMVAAVTFGLPEKAGGARNWDYRYCWVRDTAFAMYAFVRLGLVDEVESFVDWIGDRVRDGTRNGSTDPLRVMYRLDGGTSLDEYALDEVDGWGGARPVLVGNEAARQFQLDIYGEVMDSLYLANKYGRSISWDGWQDVCRTVDWLKANWRRPDSGIWETRRGDQCFLHSRLMCWVAMDRAIRLAIKRSLPAPLPDWNAARAEIHLSIHEEFWNPKLNSFVSVAGTEDTDGAMLMMPLMRFISPCDPRWLGTLRRIEEQLVVDALVFRRPGTLEAESDHAEGSFLACSFWYVEVLARAGQVSRARLLFDKLIGYTNHLGLYAEELSFSGRHLGNFPQVLTHLALISAASYLDRALEQPHMQAWS